MEMVTKTPVEVGDVVGEPMDFFTTGQQTFVADGPLARAYTEALNVLYKKEMGPDGMTLESAALESQQLDADKERRFWKEAYNARVFERPRLGGAGMLYGVRRQDVCFQTLVDVADSIGRMSEQQKQSTAVVFDAVAGMVSRTDCMTVLESRADRTPIINAVKHYCAAHAVPVYESLGEFLRRNG